MLSAVSRIRIGRPIISSVPVSEIPRDESPKRTEFQVECACLATVLDFRTRRADFCLSKAQVTARLPTEEREWSLADFALFAVCALRHAHVWILTQASLTKNWEVLCNMW